MSSVLTCPNCKKKLPNRLFLIVKSARMDSSMSSTAEIKKLPCPYCNYELIDTNKLRKWAIVTLIIFFPLGIILGHRANGLLFIVPILVILFIYAVISVPLKSEVFRNENLDN